MKHSPFELALLRKPSDPAISRDTYEEIRMVWTGKEHLVLKTAEAVVRARLVLKKSQVTYKKNFDRRLQHGNTKIKVGNHVWLDV